MKLYNTTDSQHHPIPVFPKGANINLLLVLALVLTVATAAGVEHYNACLANAVARFKIVSLELAWSHEIANAVVESWSKHLHELRMSVYVDFFFIAAYGFGLFVLVKKTALAVNADPNSTVWPIWTKIAAVFPFVAMAGDAIENIFMLLFINNRNISVVLFSLPASIKFGAIVYILAYCLYASRIFQNVLKACRLYAPALVSVIASFVLFSRLTQGQDVVIQIAEYSGPKFWSIVTIILWVWFTWYSSRLVTYTRMQEYGNTLPEFYHVHPPRLLAFNALVSIQTAIVALPTLHVVDPKKLVTFFLAQNVVYFCWSFIVRKKRWSGWKWFSTALVALFTIWYAYLLVRAWISAGDEVSDQKYLIVFGAALYVISLLLLWLWFLRSRHFNEQEWKYEATATGQSELTYLTILRWRILPVLNHRKEEEQPWFKAFNIAAVVGLALYVGSFFSLTLADRMGPLAYAMLAFGILVGFANIIAIASINYKTNYFAVLLVVAIVVGLAYNPYKVRLIDGEQIPERPSLATYFDRWVEQHKEEVQLESELHRHDSTWKYPVYLVIADGGASRSGYWVASVLGALQDESIARRQEKPDSFPTIFSDHLMCLAGASGGSVGNATFYSLLRDHIDRKEQAPNYVVRGQNFLKNDFLTPVLTHWFGSDLVQHVVPMPFLVDRAGSLEQVVEKFAEDSMSVDIERRFVDVVDASGELPILFINTTSVRKGKPAVVSSVALDSTISSRIDVIANQPEKTAMRYSTAFILGARFPYVSPAGQLGAENYVDGGYFDNTGAGIVHEMLQFLIPRMKAKAATDQVLDSVYQKLEFRILYIRNSSLVTSPIKGIHPLANDLASPILTVLGTYSSQTDVNNLRLKKFMCETGVCPEFIEVNLYKTKDDLDYPMNWVISNYNLERMNGRLKEVQNSELKMVTLE